MRLLLYLFVIITNISFGQSTYFIERDAYIYGVGNGEFLTAVQKNNKAHFKHYNNIGDVVWEDSISFNVAVDNSQFNWISKFKNTDDLVVCMRSDLTPLSSTFSNDTMLYHFAKFNLNTHQFVQDLEDTIFLNVIVPFEYNDTSLYLSINDFSNGSSSFHHATYSLNSNMELSLVAPSSSIPMFSFGWSYYSFDNKVYKYQNNGGYHFIDQYSMNINHEEHYECYISTGEQYDYTYYRKAINSDSVFVFTEGYSYTVNNRTKWRFDWRNLDLSQIASYTSYSHTNDELLTSPQGFRTGSDKVKLDKLNRRILILGEEKTYPNEPPYYFTKVQQSVLIYDYDFELVCEVPIATVNNTLGGVLAANRLVEINGLVYLLSEVSNGSKLTRMDCELLSLDESNPEHLSVTIFPNPVDDNLNIVNNKEVDLKIHIQSLDGKIIKSISKNEISFKIDMTDLVSGVYLVVLESGGIVQIERVIKN